jgi:hypothetical protein
VIILLFLWVGPTIINFILIIGLSETITTNDNKLAEVIKESKKKGIIKKFFSFNYFF